MANTCLLTKHTNPNTYTAAPGKLMLVLTSTKGSVAFDPGNTTVTDSTGKGPSGYKCTAQQLSFSMDAANTYTLDVSFTFAGSQDTGKLQDTCQPPVLDDLVDITFTPTYTIVVS